MMEIALGAIVVLLLVIAVLLWDILKSLNRLEDAAPAVRDLLQVVERKERRERVGAYFTDSVIEQQKHRKTFNSEPPTAVLETRPAYDIPLRSSNSPTDSVLLLAKLCDGSYLFICAQSFRKDSTVAGAWPA